MPTAILELIVIGAKIFSDERQEYFKNRGKNLLTKIFEVEDSPFYQKDMEAKGLAERAIIVESDELRKEFMMESAK